MAMVGLAAVTPAFELEQAAARRGPLATTTRTARRSTACLTALMHIRGMCGLTHP